MGFFDELRRAQQRQDKSITPQRLFQQAKQTPIITIDQTDTSSLIITLTFHQKVIDFHIKDDILQTQFITCRINQQKVNIRRAESVFNHQTQQASVKLYIGYPPITKMTSIQIQIFGAGRHFEKRIEIDDFNNPSSILPSLYA